jgi:Gar1/Naf1 RNA binding region
VTKLTNEKIPYFNAPIYLQNMTKIGKVDEIFGPINESVRNYPIFLFLNNFMSLTWGFSITISVWRNQKYFAKCILPGTLLCGSISYPFFSVVFI